MSRARPDEQRTRFRPPPALPSWPTRPPLGFSEILVGGLLADPGFDPGDLRPAVGRGTARGPRRPLRRLVSRHLPALLHHRGLVAVGLVLFGLAKLLAAVAMWEGQEWGGYLLAASVALLLPFYLRQAVTSPTPGHVLLAAANAAALVVLVLLLRGWRPARPLGTRATGT
jgi:hypothetical protein